MTERDPNDIAGPIDHTHASHWVHFDHVNLTVETWCKTGPDYQFALRTRVRPMSESEIILSKVRDHSRDAVLRAFGIKEVCLKDPLPPPRVKPRRWLHYLKGPRNVL